MLLIGDESEAARLPQHILEAVVNNSIQTIFHFPS